MAALAGIGVVAVPVALARGRRPRWRCQGCGHAYTAHLDMELQVGGCAVGASLAGLLGGSACSCQVYVGRVPPARLMPRPPTAPIPTEKG